MEQQASLVQPSQNPFLQTLNEVTATFGALGSTGLSLYSTFLGAKETAKLQARQATGYQDQPTQSSLLPFSFANGSSTTWLLAAIAIAGTGFLLYKAVK